MSRVEKEHWDGKEVSLLAFAKKLRDAKKIEETLNNFGVDYLVELGEYTNFMSIIFGSKRTGVFFYVLSDNLQYGIEILEKNNLKGTIVLEEKE